MPSSCVQPHVSQLSQIGKPIAVFSDRASHHTRTSMPNSHALPHSVAAPRPQRERGRKGNNSWPGQRGWWMRCSARQPGRQQPTTHPQHGSGSESGERTARAQGAETRGAEHCAGIKPGAVADEWVGVPDCHNQPHDLPGQPKHACRRAVCSRTLPTYQKHLCHAAPFSRTVSQPAKRACPTAVPGIHQGRGGWLVRGGPSLGLTIHVCVIAPIGTLAVQKHLGNRRGGKIGRRSNTLTSSKADTPGWHHPLPHGMSCRVSVTSSHIMSVL